MAELQDRPEGSILKGGNCNNHRHQYPQNSCKNDWYHRDACSEAHSPPLQRGLPYTTSVPDSYSRLVNNPFNAEADEQNRQNNSCHCGVCYDSCFDSRQGNHINNVAYRRGPTNHRVCCRSHSAEDSSYHSDLHEVCDKLIRVSKWGRLRTFPGGFESCCGVNDGSQSVLTRQLEPPHTRCLIRVKPFQRHEMYQRMWKMQPAIGDNFRYSLRQKVRQNLLRKDEVQLPHKIFVPNLYTVPTMKARYDLRWIVRECNHNYKMPPCGAFYEV